MEQQPEREPEEKLLDWRNSAEHIPEVPEFDSPGTLTDEEMAKGDLQYELLMRAGCGTLMGLFAALLVFSFLPFFGNIFFAFVSIAVFFIVALPVYIFGEPLIKWIQSIVEDLW